MDTLTRGEALALIDDCMTLADLAALATDWIGNSSLVDGVPFIDGAEALRDYVESCCDSDAERSRGPLDSDDTGIAS